MVYTPEDLSKMIDAFEASIDLPTEPRNLYDPIKYILFSGGKRIRPVLTLAACNLFSDNVKCALSPAYGLEVFHNFTLVHDDIMDNAVLRRGKKTIHSKWNLNVAILSGDAMNILAYHFLTKVEKKYLNTVIDVFNELALGICEGQQLDVDFEKQNETTLSDYLRMIELKTAILIKGALQIGATMGDATKKEIDNIGQFGLNLGIAFQLQDDLLDLYGTQEVFGKKQGGDIVANKKTILIINARNHVKYRGELDKLFNTVFDNEHSKVQYALEIFNKYNVRHITENQILEFYNKSIASLERIKVDQARKQTLLLLAQKVLNRIN